MAISTKQKVKYLTKFVIDFADTLADIDRSNITGIRVDKKIAGGEERSNYAIVFQVKNKIDKAELDDSNVIPDYVEVTFPDNEIRKIYTDIQASGEIELHAGIGSEISCDQYSYGSGSVGLYVKDPLGGVFAVTNYHVVAKKRINNGNLFYQSTDNTKNVIVGNVNNPNGVFTIGEVNQKVDVAFVKLDGEHGFTNSLPDGPANGIWDKAKILSSLKGQTVSVYSLHKNGAQAVVSTALMPVSYPGTNVMISVIKLDRIVSGHGDSGGLVIDSLNRIVGIIMGAGADGTYVIPFYAIVNFKSCFPI